MNTLMDEGSATKPARAAGERAGDSHTVSTWTAGTQSAAMSAVWLLATFCLVNNLITGSMNGSAVITDFITLGIWVIIGLAVARNMVVPKPQ